MGYDLTQKRFVAKRENRYSGFRLFASRICQRKYCNKAVPQLPESSIQTESLTELQTADADDSFVLLTDVHHWDLNHLFLFLCKTNYCLILYYLSSTFINSLETILALGNDKTSFGMNSYHKLNENTFRCLSPASSCPTIATCVLLFIILYTT